MLKPAVKTALFLIIAVFLAFVSAFGTYFLTKNSIKDHKLLPTTSTAPIVPASNEAVSQSNKIQMKLVPTHFEYYTVRLEGSCLGVYATHNGSEEFLYNEAIYKNDLSPEDINLLSTGVNLNNSAELTEFLENFTS